MARSDDENPSPPPQQTPTQQTPRTVSTIKLPILKKGEYDIWAMKMGKHYLSHNRTILYGKSYKKEMVPVVFSTGYKMEFGGNDESKKMQKYILKQQFEGFSVSNSEGSHKGYDRFQSLLSQLEILVQVCSPLKMPIRSSLGLYLLPGPKVFESDVKGSTGSSSNSQNVAFISFESIASTNDQEMEPWGKKGGGGEGVGSGEEGGKGEGEGGGKGSGRKGREPFDSMRLKKFYKTTCRRLQFDAKEPVGFNKTKVECFNCHNTRHFARECRSKGNQESKIRDAGNTGYRAKDNGRRTGKQEKPKELVEKL
ncbi:ribonuclease H-like domain-containing protein [Tanacetum coccineum]|uniref:Ribonuclease H-like domain-containing protein n=1 Tax=Tanacetum coccineum TaxID=301880 RepID=A0ABQ5A0U0_9ASTR